MTFLNGKQARHFVQTKAKGLRRKDAKKPKLLLKL